MSKRIVKDEQGRKWQVLARGCLRDKTGKELFEMQQRAADEQREKGRGSWARAIESKSWIDWIHDSGIITWKKRIG